MNIRIMMVVHSNGIGSMGNVGSVGKKCIFLPLLCRTTRIININWAANGRPARELMKN
ncbi:hypothetical protein [Dapis sp. BLCC M229]|uniref:hypothetical protein n=1 Tax=Dapis sp. BLCC M229 TaxID=3400188 RepID=UPI003CFA5AF4